ncbi:MAG: arginine--tRNA ligase [Lachnospiraceae bacterium]|nr:arginine--tRNA ligase [Lachnospiraceae bacterium]
MKKLLDNLTEELIKIFDELGYDNKFARVSFSNRPDLCEFQCNGAMALAKSLKRPPIEIAGEIAEKLSGNEIFKNVTAVAPGFLNMDLSDRFISDYIREMTRDEYRFGCDRSTKTRTILIDYGGPNVAKPLHVGHLRSAVIGESIKRMGIFMGNTLIGDVHLGDWGLQMGLIIHELSIRRPDLPYFNQAITDDYPKEPPFTISELEEIYPTASAKSKEDEKYKAKAMQAVKDLQQGRPGYMALWQHIIDVSVNDLKKNYKRLNVSFEVWKGESDADPYIPEMVRRMKDQGFAHESEGALVVDVKRDDDTKEIPPCIILKSDGAALYQTTDLATLVQRENSYHPDDIIYVVDKRQEMHFTQVFRCARKTGIVPDDTALHFLGFGTMNGPDGKPFKTRDGGIMRLENLLDDIEDKMYSKVSQNESIPEDEARDIAAKISVAAVKYGDLSNQASKDYIFDPEKFTSFEGNTGPYILYTMVRIKSILAKYAEAGGDKADVIIQFPGSASEKGLMLSLAGFNGVIENAFDELAPHKVCAYVYELANAFNKFYHETKILSEEDEDRKKSYISLINLTLGVLEKCIDVLGFEAPERM